MKASQLARRARERARDAFRLRREMEINELRLLLLSAEVDYLQSLIEIAEQNQSK